MKSVTQEVLYRQALILYAEKHGVTKAAIRYKTNRQYIYRWMRRYDGTKASLQNRSRRPHHHPNQHTEEELRLIGNMRRRNPNAGLVVFWVKLRQRGYTRSIASLYYVLLQEIHEGRGADGSEGMQINEPEADFENHHRCFHDRGAASPLDSVLPYRRGSSRMARRHHFPAVCSASCSEYKMVQKPLSGKIFADPRVRNSVDAVRTSLHGRLHDQRYSAVPLCVPA